MISFFMSFHISKLVKCHRTSGINTFIRFLTGMYAYMSFQIKVQRKSSITMRSVKWFFSTMCQLMSRQLMIVFKYLISLRSFILTAISWVFNFLWFFSSKVGSYKHLIKVKVKLKSILWFQHLKSCWRWQSHISLKCVKPLFENLSNL